MTKKYAYQVATLLFSLMAVSTAHTAPVDLNWQGKIKSGTQLQVCAVAKLKPIVNPKRPSQLFEEFTRNEDSFSLFWRKSPGMLGLLGAQSKAIPIQDVTRIQYANTDQHRIKHYQATLKSGEVVDGNDNFGALLMCKEGDEAWHKRCLVVYQIEVTCMHARDGSQDTGLINMDFNGNGEHLRSAPNVDLVELIPLTTEEAQRTTAAIESIRTQYLQLQASKQREHAEKAEKLVAERELAITAYRDRMNARAAPLRKAKPGTKDSCVTEDGVVSGDTPNDGMQLKCQRFGTLTIGDFKAADFILLSIQTLPPYPNFLNQPVYPLAIVFEKQ